MRKSNKLVSFLVAAVLGLAPMSAMAASAAPAAPAMSTSSNVLSIDPLSWVTGNIRLQYENAINNNLSWVLPLNLGLNYDLTTTAGTNAALATGQTFGLKVGAGLKYYITGKAADHGLYANGNLLFRLQTGGANSLADLAYAMNAGYSHNFCGFWIDGYAGLIGSAVPFSNATATQAAYWTPAWNIGVKIGYAW